jgi:hypothetical protein
MYVYMNGTPWFSFAMVEASCRLEEMFKHTFTTNRTTATIAKPYFDELGCIIHVDILYRTYTCYNCLSEDEPLSLKCTCRWYCEKLNLAEVHLVGIHYMIISQCMVQITYS